MDTAPTEMYTYCRPLALHAALPICCLAGCGPLGRSRAVRVGGLDVVDQYTWSQGPRVALSYAKGVARPCILTRSNQCGKVRGPRSEEHTSELQSLMRISYAVFCLKKKKIKDNKVKTKTKTNS